MSNFANPELENSFLKVILASNTAAAPAIVFANDLTKGLYWDISGLHLTGLSASPIDSTEAASKAYVDASVGGGGVSNPMTSDLDAGTHSITNLTNITFINDGVTPLITSNAFSVIVDTKGNGIAEKAGNGGLFLLSSPNSEATISALETGSFDLISNGSSSGNVEVVSSGTTVPTSALNIKLNNILIGKFDASTTAHDTRLKVWNVDHSVLEKVVTSSMLPSIIDSSATTGGAATEAVTVTGLLTTSTIWAVTQRTKGGANLPLLSWTNTTNGQLNIIYSADMGSGAVVRVLFTN